MIFVGLAGLGVFGVQGSIVSADYIQYESNSDFFDGDPVLKLVYDTSSTAEDINAELSAQEIADDINREVTQSLSISVSNVQNTIRYDLQKGGRYRVASLEKYSSRSDSLAELRDEAQKVCYDLNGDQTLQVKQPGESVSNGEYVEAVIGGQDGQLLSNDYGLVCYRVVQPYGQAAEIGNGDLETSAEFTVQAEGKESQSATVSNSDIGEGQTTRLGDNVLIQWKNNLDTGQAKPRTSDELALYQGNRQGWKLIRESSYSSYQSHLESQVVDNLRDAAQVEGTDGKPVFDRDRTEDILNQHNDLAADAGDTYTAADLQSGEFTSSSFSSASIEYTPQTAIAFPAFSIYIDAVQYFTVEKPVGQPQFESVSGGEVPETGTGQVTAQIRNTADFEGTFTARIKSCSEGFTSTDLTREKTHGPGETLDYVFDVAFTSDSSEKEVSGSCTVEVKNADGTTTLTQDASLTGISESTCTPGQRFKDIEGGSTQVRLCDSDGVGSTLVEECTSDEQVARVDGELQCVEENTRDGSTDQDTDSEDENCVLFQAGQDSPVAPDIKLKNPFCGLGDTLDSALGVIHLATSFIFALAISTVSGTLTKFVDGRFFAPGRTRNRRDAVSQGRGLPALAVGLTVFLVAFLVALSIPVWIHVLTFLVLTIGAVVLQLYSPFIPGI